MKIKHTKGSWGVIKNRFFVWCQVEVVIVHNYIWYFEKNRGWGDVVGAVSCAGIADKSMQINYLTFW